ncbi:hypothetical protein BpHYR1_009474 [Brachionus plicatilis]|uniref:Uncharacterized protein n=1 Tax=Brachionus plicatilis TaxID=10195 RepID=A0A3M7RZW0_BRAPC|nr:hypothetical protein BpHYR1_009474 [Brachionus plicatilis]
MIRLNFSLVLFSVLLIHLIPSFFALQFENDEDYSWDYDQNSPVKPPMSKEEIISLKRDYNGRADPDKYPSDGFFPVWVFCLLILSGFFHVMAIITGLCHVLGCRGKRPVEVKQPDIRRKISASLVEYKRSLSNRNHSVVGEH